MSRSSRERREDRRDRRAVQAVVPSVRPYVPSVSVVVPDQVAPKSKVFGVNRPDAVASRPIAQQAKPVPIESKGLDVRNADAFQDRAPSPARQVRYNRPRMQAKVPDLVPATAGQVVAGQARQAAAVLGDRPLRRADLAANVPGGQTCRQENRPVSNRGNGSSRDFVPWCQKGKK